MEWYYHEIFCAWAAMSIFALLSGFTVALTEDKPFVPFFLFLFVSAIAAILVIVPWIWNHLFFSMLILAITVAIYVFYKKIPRQKFLR